MRLIFWGPPGVGKDDDRRLLAVRDRTCTFCPDSAHIFSGGAELRKALMAAKIRGKNRAGHLVCSSTRSIGFNKGAARRVSCLIMRTGRFLLVGRGGAPNPGDLRIRRFETETPAGDTEQGRRFCALSVYPV